MKSVAASFVGDHPFVILGALAVVAILLFTRRSFRHMRAQRKQQQLREQQRQQFWGYE
jgi:hypothetical protein